MSQRSLTGYDNQDVDEHPSKEEESSGVSAGTKVKHYDEEVFLYNASTGKLICASCDPSGARPHGVEYQDMGPGDNIISLAGGHQVWHKTTWIAANVPGWTPYHEAIALYQSRYLSNEGRLFFNSHDALVPGDVNGTEDVYEWEPPAVGNCTVGGARYGERSGGCVGLISSGTSDEESAFLDSSVSGSDVFFIAQSGLAGRTSEATLSVYDAHECTPQSPCPPAAGTPPPACETEATCRPASVPQPTIFGRPPSGTFNGPGNSPPASPTVTKVAKKTVKCKRGDVRSKKGKCVRKKSKKTRAKKSAHTNRRTHS
jgi:hypothetical protein